MPVLQIIPEQWFFEARYLALYRNDLLWLEDLHQSIILYKLYRRSMFLLVMVIEEFVIAECYT